MERNNLAEMVKQQAELIQQLRARIAELEAEIARLNKNSSNSSKPPSSDIVKPEKPANENGTHEKRKRGAQHGHTRHLRQPFPPSQVDTFVEITLENCPLCGGALEQTGEEPEIHQQVELVEKPFKVTEYQLPQYWCEHCQTYHTGTLPYKVAKTGLFGISLIALVAYMKGRCHCFPNSPVNGYNNLTTATSYNNTGSVYYRSGDYAKALEYYQKDLAIKEEVLGKNHPNTVKVSGSIAKAYNNRGFAYDEKGDYDQAITDFEMVVKLAPNDDEYREYLERAKAEKARKHAN